MVRSYTDAGLSLEWMSGATGRWVLHVTPERRCIAPKGGGDEETARREVVAQLGELGPEPSA